MKFGKIRPVATIVAQFAAGVEVEAIQHEGKMFLPVAALGDFLASDGGGEDAPKPKTDKKPEPAPASANDGGDNPYTEDELMDMDVKQLTKILKDDFDIDPADYPGKNTNKKLRDLILKAQEEDGDGDKDDDNEEKKPSKSPKKPAKKDDEDENEEDNDDLVNSVADLLEDFDGGKKNKKKTVAAIVELIEGADEETVAEMVDDFEEDGDADIDEVAEKIVKAFSAKEEKKPRGKKAPAKKKDEDEDLVDIADLEVGDRVSVYWDDDNQDWFDGEVKSIKKGKVTIAYDDDTEDVIDPKVHTKIKRLAD